MLGVDGINIEKCTGRATDEDVKAGRATEQGRRATDHANHFAVKGRELAEEAAPTLEERDGFMRARRW